MLFRSLGLKHTPSLTFVLDALPETAAHIDELLQQAAAADEAVHAQAKGATFAGESDPYKHPDEDSDNR